MGTNEQTTKTPPVATATTYNNNNSTSSSVGVGGRFTETSATNSGGKRIDDTHTSDSSKNTNVVVVATTHSSNNANTNSTATEAKTTTAETTTTTTSAMKMTTTTTPTAKTTANDKLHTTHHSKAQVIIIPATPASTVATNAAKKIRRAFSMPRNPFQWSRKFKTNGGGVVGESGSSGGETRGGGSNSALTACVGGGRSGRNGSVVSLNSYTAVCKDTNGDDDDDGAGDDRGKADAKATQQNSQQQRQDKKTSSSGGGGNRQNTSGSGSNRVFRRSSLRKFINRIAQHVSTSVNIGANKHASSQANSLSSSDRVPPIGGYQWPADQTPGVTGLKNHGNTCFMNAVLQCLSHTDILAEYFVLDQYKADLKRRNKINSRKFGTKGELTEQLANVLKALWTCKNESDHSTSFKAVVDRYGSQFRSSTQHDAQEFLFWLLDKVHEDLNTATKRRYKSVKNNYGRPDEIIAAETLANHIRCNNSFVQAVFQAQFRSSLTCPRCKKQSNTFDPFHCISVQLPQLTQQTIFVTVLYLKQHPRQVKLGLTVPAGSPIVALREQLHTDTGIASDRMVLVDLTDTGFSRVFYDTQPVSTLAGIETIHCIEVPEHNVVASIKSANDVNKLNTNATTTNTITTNSTATATAVATSSATATTSHNTDLLLLIANVKKKKKSSSSTEEDGDAAVAEGGKEERFGTPFCLRAPRDCSYSELQKKLLREMSSILKPEVFAYATPLKEMFQIRLQDPSADPDTYLEQVEHPLLTEMIDLALSVLSAEAGPAHIKLLLEWPEPEKHFSDLTNTVVEHESVARLLEKKTNDTAALTLEQCLEHYTKAETLSAEDAWRCPHCQQYLPVVKTLGLWSLPDILVVHFKRFRQHQAKGSNAAKLTTMVKFPLNAFDMAPHLAKGTRESRESLQHEVSTGHYNRPSPWKKTRPGDSRSSTLNSHKENRETCYDLYAVCYHQGDTLETGHYTAACKNPYDHQWYKFDDQRVSKVPSDSIEEEIINNEAYMLFYQRRSTDVAECSGSSSTSGEHWVSKIAPPIPSEKPAATATVGTVTATEVTAAGGPKIDTVPERAETKPVEIPKVEGVVVVKELSEDVEISVPKREMLTPLIVNEEAKEKDIVDIEGLEYADDAAEDADMDELDALEKLTPIDGSPTEEINHIFEMDEDCKLNDSTDAKEVDPPIAATANNSVSPVKSKSPMPARAVAESTEQQSPVPLVNGNGKTSPKPTATTSVASNSSASSSTSSLSSRSSPHSLAVSTFGASTLQSKFNGFSASSSAQNYKEALLSSSLKSNSSSIIAAAAAAHSNDFHLNRLHYQQHWHGSRSSVSAVENATSSTQQAQHPHHTNCLNLRHSFSTSSNYKLKECSDTLSTMLRNSANTCSKDTLIFIDQQSHHHHHHHSLMEDDDDDDTFMGSRSLWISPVTPHKLITVSPKN